MSAAPATATPTTAGTRTPRATLLRRAGAGAATAALAVAATLALWPASAADQAREDGRHLGESVAALQSATTSEEVDAALADVDAALADTREHAGDEVAGQVADQEDALERAADGFVGVHTSEDSFSVDLYQAELNEAVDDLASQGEEFRTAAPEVEQAFWEGVDEGLGGA